MNKQTLSTLTLQQLKLHKDTLNKRIDDLKFFNLDLGRENIRLAEQYKVARQQADKVKQGKTHKLRRAKHFTKNIYLQNQNQYSHIQRVQKQKNQQKNHGLKLNDIYKVGKNKLTNWWGSSSNHNGKNTNNANVNQQMQNYYHSNQPYDYHNNNGQYNKEQIMIVADCPPVQVMKQSQHQQRDPMQQQITYIIKQHAENNNSIDNHQQIGNYERLYYKEDNQRYIRQSQKQQMNISSNSYENYYRQQQNTHKVYHYDQQQSKQTIKQHPNRKNFEFDDLPGMGWRKLKGLIGFGNKNKNKQQKNNKNIKDQNQIQRQTQYYQQQVIIRENNRNEQQYQQETNPNDNNTRQQQPRQRKRIPIFNSTYNNIESKAE